MTTLFKDSQQARVDQPGFARRFQVDVYKAHAPVWQALVNRNWCSLTTEAIELEGDGVHCVPLIQSLRSRERLAPLRCLD
jgi:hypothetical protein